MAKKTSRSKVAIRKEKMGWRITPIVKQIAAAAGSQLALSKALTPAVSRPLLVALCQGKLAGTPNSIGQLSQACSAELADQLLKAYLEDVLEEVGANAGPMVTRDRSPKTSSIKHKVVLIGSSERDIIESYFARHAVPEHFVKAVMKMAERCSTDPAFRSGAEKSEAPIDLVPAHLTYGLIKPKR